MRVLWEVLPTFLPKNCVGEEDRGRSTTRRACWGELVGSASPTAFDAQLRPRNFPCLGVLAGSARDAKSPRLLLGGGGWETERRACSGELVGSASQLSFNAQLGLRNSPLCLGRVAGVLMGCKSPRLHHIRTIILIR